MGTKKQYEALERSIRKHKALIQSDYGLSIFTTIKDRIFKCDLIENYDWVIPSHVEANDNWFSIKDDVTAGTFGSGTPRTISWEDTDSDPNGAFLLSIRFPTGGYFFDKKGDQEFFKQFWNELRELEPDYQDTANRGLYFTKEKGGKVLREYDRLVKKYRDLHKSQANERRAAELRSELEKLEG